MIVDIQLIFFVFLAFVLGVIVSWLIFRSKTNLIIENQKAELTTDLKLLKQKYDKLAEYFTKQRKKLKINEINNHQLLEKNKQIATKQALAEQQVSQLESLAPEIEQQKQFIQINTNENAELKAKVAELRASNNEQLKSAQEKIELLQQTKEELKIHFKSLANDIFEEKDKKFSHQNKQNLDAILNPFSKQLDDFKHKVDDVYNSEGKQRASLLTEIKNLRELNQQLNQEAINLTQALKGDKKLQGNWGELILERVLEQSGLRKDFEYQTQGGFRDSENQLLKPDVIVHLPQDKEIVIDSKVSLIAYERYSSAEDSDFKEKERALKEHIAAINNHIKTLSDKNYSSLYGIKTLDFVLLFIPIEPAFTLAFSKSENLYSDAFNRKIIIVTPTTLLATLKTIENLWRYEKQNQNAREIANKAGNLYDKFRGFVEDIEKLGKQLDTTQNTYVDAVNKLNRGKGNLVSQAQQLLNLGVKVKKELPKTLLEKSDIEGNNE